MKWIKPLSKEPRHQTTKCFESNRPECSKMSVQQGRSLFDARSVLPVREHGKKVRTPLAAFFNIPYEEDQPNLEGTNNRGGTKQKKVDK
jgi:hypothetical protein